jgi:hypothetical protein
MKKSFVKISLKDEWLQQAGLPDIEYPIPATVFEEIIDSGKVIEFSQMLFWLQEYSSQVPGEWMDYEEAMLRIAVKLAPYDPRPQIGIFGENWFLMCGRVNLAKEIITIQRRDYLIAAIQNYGDGRLLACSYRPLDSKTARYLMDLAVNPAPDGTVCTRSNNWEYALDCSAGIGNVHASRQGESYLSHWEFGLGLGNDKTLLDNWYSQRAGKPIPPNVFAKQILINYEQTSTG